MDALRGRMDALRGRMNALRGRMDALRGGWMLRGGLYVETCLMGRLVKGWML